MPSICEVCSSEPSKYRCPTCGLMSCSLACTQSHKIYCAPPKVPESLPTESPKVENDVNGHAPGEEKAGEKHDILSPEALGSSKELKELFSQYPQLRDQLRDIYKVTLEEAWAESQVRPSGRRPFGKGRGPHRVNRGPWTPEKGFRRGLGKVRKLRVRCEDGVDTGRDAEGFMGFITLVNGESRDMPMP